MQSPDLLLIIVAEVSALLLVVCLLLGFQNRALRHTVRSLKDKIARTLQELKRARSSAAPTPLPLATGLAYDKILDKQIQLTREHHKQLGSSQDIALDIEAGTPLPHRTAALRYALLVAEREALGQDNGNQEPNWKHLRARYEKIFEFQDEYSPVPESGNQEETETLKQELENARKRVKNLEKFKSLYMELEQKWESSSVEAQARYDNLSLLAAQFDVSGEFGKELENYHSVYNGISSLIEAGADAATGQPSAEFSSEEVKRLRSVAADQHKIISELQRQLREASTESERTAIVTGLQGELNKQMRFVQESETCIQLLEDELSTANHELEQLRARNGKVQSLKSEVLELRKNNGEMEVAINALRNENRKLTKRLQEVASSPKVDSSESIKLRKELVELEAKYNDLEEKFLDLKLQQ